VYTGRDKADVFIIGGGPAGLAAAIAARKKGFSVMVADGAEPPIDKACGEGMMPETQAALRELGVEVPSGAGYRFRGIQFVQGSVQVAVDFPEGRGIGVRRTALHELLIQEAEKLGIKLLWKTTVAGIAPDGVRLRDREVRTRWIIGADGGTSRVRRWSELNTPVLTHHRIASRRHYRVRPWTEYMEIYWGPQVQAYVTPISMEEVCVVVLAEKPENANFERALEALPELRERLAGAELCSRERGATTTMQSLARVCRGNVALVGDASGGVDAITGEGLRLAFRQAQALAEAMECGDLRQYEHAHRKLARRPIWMGKVMLQLGRNSRIRGRVLRMLKKNPGLFARLLAIHVGRATTAGAVVTGVQAGWQMLAS
jgi:flavin-dependent dehydrogenase